MSRSILAEPGRPTRAGRAAVVGIVFAILCACGHSDPAHAHLALVRQGPESAGTAGDGDEFGRALATGDFNGDGVEDLAAGAPFEANNTGGTAAHGAVVVSFGSAVGLVPEGAQLLSVGDLPDLSVRYGEALAAGDFNRDGIADLAVGLPHRDVGGLASAGEVWIHYGTPLGLNTVPGIVLNQAGAGGGVESNDRFGNALVTSDFNNDGYDDLVVGAPGEDADAGAVFHFYGSAAGLGLAGAGWFKQSSLGQVNNPGDAMGHALAAGRFDNDAYPDLAIGTPFKNLAALVDCGRVYILRGSSVGLLSAGNVAFDPVSLGNDPQGDARFGYSLAAGWFFDKTGPFDLAVGEPEADLGGQGDAGRVVVLDFDPVPAPSLVPQDLVTLNQIVGFPGIGAEAGDRLGLALAAGRFDSDSFDDLAVSVPYENLDLGDEGSFNDAGLTHVYYGGPNGPGFGTTESFSAKSQNDHTATGDLLGWALAFGRFDNSGRDNLAIGVIWKDYQSYVLSVPTIDRAGLVYIVAPWRQIQGLPHRSSVALDCNQEIIYSQRMFDRTRPASTTKTMTLLLACEAVENGEADPDALYTVPSWVANNVGGSQMGLVAGEKITLEYLMKGMMPPSGNDASYAVADILEGDNNPWGGSYENTLLAFQDRMNARAADFGMSRTTLTNPSGLDVTNHYTTARDFAALSYYAMQNSCVRQLVGAPGWLVTHYIPVSTMDGWLSIGGPGPMPGFTEVTEYFFAGYLANIKSAVPSATGIKGGFTGEGRITGLWSAESTEGEVYATAFGLRSEDDGDLVSDCLSCTGGGLLELGRAVCEEDDIAPPPPPPPPGPYGTFTSIPACPDSLRRLTTHGEDFTPGDALVELYRRTHVAPAVGVRLAIVRNSQVTLAPLEAVSYSVGAITGHEGARIVNRGTGNAQVQITQTLPGGTTLNATLPPSGGLNTPTHGSPASDYLMTIRNVGASEIVLEVDELGYRLERRLLPAGPNVPSFQATLRREGRFSDEMMGVYLVGTDAACDEELDLVIRPPDAPSAAPGETRPAPGGAPETLAVLPAWPNPFSNQTAIAFELPRSTLVEVSLYDLQGRRIRRLGTAGPLAAGRHEWTWDGRDDRGVRVGAGVYFVRVRAEGATRSGRLVKLD